jgi:hypothetical protein
MERARRSPTTEGGLASAKTGLFQPFEDVVAGLLGAELLGENSRVEERGKVHDDDTIALGILVSSHLGVGGSKERTGEHLNAAPGAAGESAVTALDRFGVAAKEKIRKA